MKRTPRRRTFTAPYLLPLALAANACAGAVARPAAGPLGLAPAVASSAAVAPATADVSFAPDAQRTVAAALEATDERDAQGRRFDVYPLTLRAGERVRVDLGGSFDAFLRIEVPEHGAPLENDDAEEGTLDARVQFVAPVAGEYRIVATSFAADSLGRYRLRVARGAGIPRPPAPQGPSLTNLATRQGGLTAASPTQGDNRHYEEFRFDGRRGDLVVLDLESQAFDTYLSVVTPDGERWTSDDVTGANTNSRVQATLPSDGTYAVRVSSFAPNRLGPFSLRLERTEAPVRGALDASGVVRELAGRRGRGAVYGVFVGIRDYGGEAGNLDYCDDDARLLASALRDAGVQTAAQQVVLVNGEATVPAVRGALERLGARVGPEDVLVFFYSGHGSQVRGTVSPAEPDGLDETLRLRGGSLRDDELAALLAPVQGTALVALDSCYSGGFARDVVSAPNRVGIFSSEEDVLSNVAARYRAGGYLSYWLRLALAGGADRDGDRSLRWGEVLDYLYGEFAAHRSETSTTGNGGGRTFQHLVVARGSVVHSDLLFRYPSEQGAR